MIVIYNGEEKKCWEDKYLMYGWFSGNVLSVKIYGLFFHLLGKPVARIFPGKKNMCLSAHFGNPSDMAEF